ncbi:MAG: amidohydrolase family protein [Actinomycetota bacterium]
MNRTWLDRRTEPVLEPELEIVDAHHHLWTTETRYGVYDLDDLHVDTGAGHNVVATVFIDCGASYRIDGPEAKRPVGETEYVAERADRADEAGRTPIAAIVSHVDLTLGTAAGEVLDAHIAAAGGRFRGIRHSGARGEDPAVPTSRTEPPADLFGQASFRAGAGELAARGLSFEAWQYHHQLDMVVELARAVPELTIVVNHLGGPIGVGGWASRRTEVEDALRAGWAAFRPLPNVVLKLGGIGMTRFGMTWHERPDPPSSAEVVERWGALIREAIDTLGPERCLFESNFPVDGETTGYGVLWNAFKTMTTGYTPEERALLFTGTARRVYRI